MGWAGQVLRIVVRTARRLGVFLAGTGIIVLGIVLIPLPGPGWAIVIAGLAVLATEFTWAEALLRFAKRHAAKATGVALNRVTALQRFAFLRRFADRDHDGTSDVVDLLQPEAAPDELEPPAGPLTEPGDEVEDGDGDGLDADGSVDERIDERERRSA
jgi:uncharacterized protein (TIGR02611 family)